MSEKLERERVVYSINIGSIGVITWIVFLVLKLVNLDNPKFDWLTWFWVWFPLWIVPAVFIAICLILFIISLIVYIIDTHRS